VAKKKVTRDDSSIADASSTPRSRKSDKIRSTSSKAKKPARSKKVAIEKIETEAAPVPATVFDPTDEQIQMRAYFISERRRRFDLPGDANTDWLEAKRQLLAETRH
jgi:hypothetical protein